MAEPTSSKALVVFTGKEPACQSRRSKIHYVQLGLKDPLEESIATHSSILAHSIPSGTDRLEGFGLIESLSIR